jgi:hypothetical protein
LPSAFTETISLLWVDVQGWEGYIFLGAERLLSTGIPVASELWPYGMRRAGMSQEQFCEIAERFWSSYWVLRRGKFIQYPIQMLNVYFDELGYDGAFDNIIFT